MGRDPKLAEDGKHRCDNCDEVFDADDLKDIENMLQRIEPGGMVPSGECPDPECGALCYPDEGPRDPWGDDEKYPRKDWQYEVANGDTALGYLEWLDHKRDAEETDVKVP